MSAVSSVGDLGGGYMKESLKWDENGSVRLPATLCLVSRLEGCVMSSAIARSDKNNERKRRKKGYQQQHVTAGAPSRTSAPFDSPRSLHYLTHVFEGLLKNKCGYKACRYIGIGL